MDEENSSLPKTAGPQVPIAPKAAAGWQPEQAFMEVIEAGAALVAKLGDMIPAMDAVCVHAAVHGVPYHGPTVGTELRAFRDALRDFAASAPKAAPIDATEEQGSRNREEPISSRLAEIEG